MARAQKGRRRAHARNPEGGFFGFDVDPKEREREERERKRWDQWRRARDHNM
jgi:hypothetical protein